MLGMQSTSSGPKKAGLTTLQKGCLESYLCNAMWTKTRAAQCGYLQDDTLCSLCNQGQDTAQHRLFECQAVADQRRLLIEPEDLAKLRKLLEGNPILAGLAKHPTLGQPTPCRGSPGAGIHFWCSDPAVSAEAAFNSDLFIDGSMLKVLGVPELGRAGWAVICMKQGVLYATLSGPVWDTLMQTSPMAEAAAFAAACDITSRPSVVTSDFSGVVRASEVGPKRALHRKNVLAGPLRAGFCKPGWKLIRKVGKVKSHLKAEDIPVGDPLRELAVGNGFADAHAAIGRGAHPPLDPKLLDVSKEDIRQATLVCKLAANLPPAWPPIARSERAPGKPKGEAAPAPPVLQHCWKFRDQLWRCEVCLARTSRKAPQATTAAAACPGSATRVREVLQEKLQHAIFCFEHLLDGSFILACSKCGGWTATSPRSLLQTCPGTFPNRRCIDLEPHLQGNSSLYQQGFDSSLGERPSSPCWCRRLRSTLCWPLGRPCAWAKSCYAGTEGGCCCSSW